MHTLSRVGTETDRSTGTELDLEFAHFPRDLSTFGEKDIPIPAPAFGANNIVDLAERAGLRAQGIDRQLNEQLRIASSAAVASVKQAARSGHEAGYRDGYVRGSHYGMWCGFVAGVLAAASAALVAHHWMGL
jgi:hypothetical protein